MMNHLKFETPDMVAGNIEKIGALFPAAITEMRGEDGQIKKGINFEVLKQLLSRDVVDGDECYEFTWVGKKAAMAEAARPITKTLRPVKEDSRDWDTTQNLYIEGDNLEVLKILQESYLGKVKMIYIDPPYNTGNDFLYIDKRSRTLIEEETSMGMYDEDQNRLFSWKENLKANPHFHSVWCSYVYKPLILARNLLADNGAIFISIDDNEQENLKKICDEVFGASNYLATFKWNRTAKAPSLSNSVRIKYEYILCYIKNQPIKLYGKQSYNTQAPLLHLPNKAATVLFPSGSIEVPASFTKGRYSEKYKVVLHDDLIEANGLNANSVRISGCFAWSESKIQSYIDEGFKFLVKKDLGTIYYYMNPESSFIPPADIINDEECGVKRNTEAKEELRKLGIEFDYSKPVSLMKYLIKSITYSENDKIILDFFSGSATTAHAVMQLNAEDGGHRKFIMVQLPEPCAEGTEAANAGFKNICEIGKERIRRAGDKIKADNPLGTQDLDTGFRVFRVDSSNMKDVYYQPDELDQQSMFDLVSNIKDDRTDMDLLYACLLDWGVEIHLPHTSTDLDGCTIHNVDNGALMACFSPNVPRSVVEHMAKQQPLRAVFRDSAFASDDAKINVTEIFKNLSPDTKVKVI